MFTTIKAAAVSLMPKPWAKAQNAEKMEKFIRRAANKNPNLVVLPEGVLEGYCVADVVLDPRLGKQFLDLAEPINGPYIQHFQKLAKEKNLCLCFGFVERVGQKAFNTAIFIDHRGKICGHYRKVNLEEGNHPKWYFNCVGNKLRAFNTPLGRCGIIICADRGNSMVVRALALDEAQMILIPTFGSKSKIQNGFVLARARENGIPVVQANRGMNMMVSKGKMIAYEWGNDRITVGNIEVPCKISQTNARIAEKNYFLTQDRTLRNQHLKYRPSIKKRRKELNIPSFFY